MLSRITIVKIIILVGIAIIGYEMVLYPFQPSVEQYRGECKNHANNTYSQQETDKAKLEQEKKQTADKIKNQEDEEKKEKEKEETEKQQKEKEEAEKLKKQREEAEKLKKEQEEAEKQKKEQGEAEKLQKEQDEAEKQQREEQEQKQKEKEEQEKQKAEQEAYKKQQEQEQEKKRIEKEKQEQKNLQQEKVKDLKEQKEKEEKEAQEQLNQEREKENEKMMANESDIKEIKKEWEKLHKKHFSKIKAEKFNYTKLTHNYDQISTPEFDIPFDEYPYMRGMTFVSDRYCPNVTFGSQKAIYSLRQLYATGTRWIALVVTEYQEKTLSLDVQPIYDPIEMSYYVHITSTIKDIVFIIRAAKSMGFRIMMKPHIDLSSQGYRSSPWRGDIGGFPNSTAWFKSYQYMSLKYAAISQILNVEIYSVSCELQGTNHYDSEWRETFTKIREVYNGNLTVSANPSEEFGKRHWDALDLIGVDTYYYKPNANTPYSQIYSITKSNLERLKSLSDKYQKPVIVAETGQCSSGPCWTNSSHEKADFIVQANFYKAFLEVVQKNSDWLKGIYFWDWNSDASFGGMDDACIQPQGKPSEEVLRYYYGGTERLPFPQDPPLCQCIV